jgi:hypothetical protein
VRQSRLRFGGFAVVLLFGLATGCSSSRETLEEGGAPTTSPSPASSPQEASSRTEAQFLGGDGARVEFEVRSEGAFEASLEGSLALGEGNALELAAAGVFGPDSVSLWLDATDEVMSWGNQANESEGVRPAGVREAVVIGFVRMGVLHNLARLVGAAPPDRMDGGVRSWVQAVDPQWVTGEPEVGARGISFGIDVAGQRSGSATIWLDPDGTMVGRNQVVQFPGGEMRVTERYRWTTFP